MSKIEIALAVGTLLSLLLHYVAAKTKTKVDDEFADAVDDGLDVLKSKK